MKKHDITDLTFLIPIRLDSIIRLENLLLTIEYLRTNFNTNIIVLEAASYKNLLLERLLDKEIKYFFIEDKDPIFHRTKYLNIMAKEAISPFLGIWDSDVILDIQQIIHSVDQLRSEDVDIVFPYDGHFYDTTPPIREHFLKNKDIEFMKRNKAKMELLYGDQMIGGAILVNKDKYIYAGMENERFYGWGPEDSERYQRWIVFDFKIARVSGSLFHLTHPRDINGKARSEEHMEKLKDMVTITCNSTKEEIKTSFKRTFL